MEINGHEIFPELVEKPRKKPVNPLGDLMRDLRHKKRAESSARAAAERERQQREADFHLSDTEDYFPDDIRDARVSGHTTCKLLELPPDILNLIVDHSLPQNGSPGSTGHAQTYTSALKHLRLIHPCFAYLRLLLTRLFGSLTLRADPDQLLELGKGTERIAPFVKKVTFCTAKVERANLPRRRRFDSADEIKRAMGRRIKRLEQEGKLLATWSSLVKQCPNLSSFSLVQGPMEADAIDLGPSIPILIGIMIKSILVSRSKAQAINIEYTFDPENERIWTAVPEWKDIDLTELREFNLSLSLRSTRIARKYSDSQAPKHESCTLLAYVLRTSAASLRKLTAAGHALGGLIEVNVTRTHGLRELHLHGLEQKVNPIQLGRLITKLDGLVKLRLEGLMIDPYYKVKSWQPVFAAIRNHANDLRVELIDLHSDSALGPKWRLNATMKLPQPACKVDGSDGVGEAITKMIKNYISRHGNWYLLNSWDPALHEESDSEPIGEDRQSDEG